MNKCELRWSKEEDFHVACEFLRKNIRQDYVVNPSGIRDYCSRGIFALAFANGSLVGLSVSSKSNLKRSSPRALNAIVDPSYVGTGLGSDLSTFCSDDP